MCPFYSDSRMQSSFIFNMFIIHKNVQMDINKSLNVYVDVLYSVHHAPIIFGVVYTV